MPVDGIVIGESSNPFMISRVLMKTLNVSHHPLFNVIEIVFAIVFIIARYSSAIIIDVT